MVNLIKVTTMTKEKTKTMTEEIESNENETFLNSLKSNEPLKKILFKAKNVSKL